MKVSVFIEKVLKISFKDYSFYIISNIANELFVALAFSLTYVVAPLYLLNTKFLYYHIYFIWFFLIFLEFVF